MAVVIFDPAAFKLEYPQFASVPDPTLQNYFNLATLYCNNTDSSVVTDIAIRTMLLNLLTAHIAQLMQNAAQPGGAPVGRLSQAAEGSVSAAFTYASQTSASMAWFIQTQYGASYFSATINYRGFRYVPPQGGAPLIR